MNKIKYILCKNAFFTFLLLIQNTQSHANNNLLQSRKVPSPLCLSSTNLIHGHRRTPNEIQDRIVTYIAELLDKRILTPSDIQLFQSKFEQGIVDSPFENSRISIYQLPHVKALSALLSLEKQPTDTLTQRISLTLSQYLNSGVSHKKIARESRPSDLPLKFVRIPKGSFTTWSDYIGGEPVQITLTHDFEVLSFPVTQKQWMQLMDYNVSKFIRNPMEQDLLFKHSQLRFQKDPERFDAPVENVTWYSAAEFADLLSLSRKLPPTYNFHFEPKAIKKRLRSPLKYLPKAPESIQKSVAFLEAGDENITQREIDSNLSPKSIYEVSGYRLPTQAEIEYIVTLAAQSLGAKDPSEYPKVIQQYVQQFTGTNLPTAPTYNPARGIAFPSGILHDLIGGVGIWTHDGKSVLFDDEKSPVGKSRYGFKNSVIDPVAFFAGDRCFFHWNSEKPSVFQTEESYKKSPNHDQPSPPDEPSVGFIMVRTL